MASGIVKGLASYLSHRVRPLLVERIGGGGGGQLERQDDNCRFF